MSVQNKNNLNYLIDPTSTNVNRLYSIIWKNWRRQHKKRLHRFILTFLCTKSPNKRRQCLDWWKKFFNLAIKNEEEAYEKIIDMNNNNDYVTDNLIYLAYYKENYKLIAIDSSKQAKIRDPQQINFIRKLENQDHGTKMFFIIEKSEETTFNFSQNSVAII